MCIRDSPESAAALCDGDQALSPEEFTDLMASLRRVLAAVDRTLARPCEPLRAREA